MGALLAYLFSWAAWWLWLLLALVAALIVYARHHLSFALTDLSYTFPLIGKLHRFSKDHSRADDGWLNVENTLCRDYAQHMSALSQNQFDNNILYLKKTYDHGRRPMPPLAMALLAVLIILESLGFSFMLSTLMVTEGSENEHNLLTLAIVLVLAFILVWVTHAAGHQLYRTGLLRSCFREYQTQKDQAFSSQIVSLDENQRFVDANQPAHVQCANRVITKPGDRGTYWWVWLAVFLILAIAIGSTKLRIDTLHSAPADGGAFISDIFHVDNDPEAATPAPQPENAATAAAREQAALTGFAILAVIFMVTQFVGMSLGYWYGFAGKQGKSAYRATRGAADFDIYWEPVQRRMNIANVRLYTLHRLLEQHSPHPLDLKHTFLDFIEEEQGRGARDLHKPPEGIRALPPPTPAEPAGASEAEDRPDAPGESPIPSDSTDQAESAAQDAASPDPLDDVLASWESAADKGARVDLLAGLDEDLRGRLFTLLSQRQAAGAERDALSKKFEDFL